jgi:hypothetical protein
LKIIYKWVLDNTNTDQRIDLPEGAQFLHFGLDAKDYPCAWFLVDKEAPPEPWLYRITGTGVYFEAESYKYLGTLNQEGNIWHLFERLA